MNCSFGDLKDFLIIYFGETYLQEKLLRDKSPTSERDWLAGQEQNKLIRSRIGAENAGMVVFHGYYMKQAR